MNESNEKKINWKDIVLYAIMIIIIIIIVLLLCKYCELTKANNKHVIKPTTSAQTTTSTTTTEAITETTTAIPTSEAVTVSTTKVTTKKNNYVVPTEPIKTTTTQATQTTQRTTSTTHATTTTTTQKVDVYKYVYKVETSETKSFYILKNGTRMNEYIMVVDNNGTPVTFSNNGIGSGLTMVNSNIDLSTCPKIKFRICNPQGLKCGETFTAGC